MFLDPERLAKEIFRSHFFSIRPSVCPSVNFAKLIFFIKLNNGTPHMTIYGAQIDRKWNEMDLQALCNFFKVRDPFGPGV